MKKISVLFVCLGNICRSPAAEALFIKKIKEKQIEDRFLVDSAAFFRLRFCISARISFIGSRLSAIN